MPEHAAPRFDLTTPRYRLRSRGVAARVSVDEWDGPHVAGEVRRLLATAGDGSIVVGAIPFDTAEPAHLYVPRDVGWGEGTRALPARSAPLASSPHGLQAQDKDSPGYRTAVASAVRRIRAGELDKVVLARELPVTAAQPFDPDAVYARLVADNPAAYTFRLDLPGDPAGTAGDGVATLLGASPELVLGSRNGRVRSHPLAGSTPRRRDPVEDAAVASALMASAKDRDEHTHVADDVGRIFRRFADDVVVPDSPALVQTPVIWHLGTMISGVLRPGLSPLELAYALHPTPAVCGWPTDAARAAIAELEPMDRGFYAGLIGWTDAAGNGEWILTLRCGIVRDTVARLYAGAGIVAGSVPEDEHTETAVKFQTFMNSLGHSRDRAAEGAQTLDGADAAETMGQGRVVDPRVGETAVPA